MYRCLTKTLLRPSEGTPTPSPSHTYPLTCISTTTRTTINNYKHILSLPTQPLDKSYSHSINTSSQHTSSYHHNTLLFTSMNRAEYPRLKADADRVLGLGSAQGQGLGAESTHDHPHHPMSSHHRSFSVASAASASSLSSTAPTNTHPSSTLAPVDDLLAHISSSQSLLSTESGGGRAMEVGVAPTPGAGAQESAAHLIPRVPRSIHNT